MKSPRRFLLAAVVHGGALLSAACGGGGFDPSTPTPVASTSPATARASALAVAAASSAVAPVSLAWVTAFGSTAVSGTQTVVLAGQALANVEVFNGGARVATATVSANASLATATIDTTQFPNGAVTLTAHAWNSPAGTAFTSDADAGALSFVVDNPVAAAAVPGLIAPGANDLNITAFGALCDGRTDDAAAIAATVAAAKAQGVAAVVPAGVCAYGDVIRLDGVRLIGGGDTSVLFALNPLRESIFMYGSGAQVRQLRLSGRAAASRQSAWEATRITLFGATAFLIDHVRIDDAAAAGIQTAQATHNGSITHNTIHNTLADAIHLTDRASQIVVSDNHIAYAGDDGIAVVSYRQDGGLVHQIAARNNVIVDNLWGRQMSVVGGSDILFANNDLEFNLGGHACVYLAQEESYATYGVHNVTVQSNTLKACGGILTGHAAIMLFSDGSDTNTNVALNDNDLYQAGPAGIRVFGAMNSAITLARNRIQGANPAIDVTSPGVSIVPYGTGAVGYLPP